jgi:hypothetical protein
VLSAWIKRALPAVFVVLGGLSACSFPKYEFGPAPDPLASVCTDGLPSDAETDIDCGGGCAPCGEGKICRRDQDCSSDSCVDGTCRAPTCDDHVKNATETDIDCGGPCAPCRVGRDCQSGSDCAEGVCGMGFCLESTCTDMVENGAETGRDCGGACGACPNGEGCGKDADCQSLHCDQGTCVTAACTDGQLNGLESSIDCGGDCQPCAAGKHCNDGPDCSSRICEAQLCTAYSCTDGVLNGGEASVDCGGPNCDGCGELSVCRDGADCASGACLSGLCVPKGPTGVALSRDGWRAKASASYPDDDPNQVLDSVGNRWTTGTPQVDGMWLEVDMQKTRAFFSVVLTCGEIPDDFPVKYDVYLSLDGKYDAPAAAGLYGGVTSTAQFDSVRLARYVKIVLRSASSRWWSINELNVLE